ncbi:MAG: hypothetical protein ACF8GE_02470 [Phycisphaerales bacterium JB043]
MTEAHTFENEPAVDQWHSHTGEAPSQESHGEIHPALIALVGLVGAVFVIATMVVLAIYFNQETRAQIEEVVEGTNVAVEYLERSARWDAEQTSYGWIDQEAGVVRIPVDAAVSIVAREYESQQ